MGNFVSKKSSGSGGAATSTSRAARTSPPVVPAVEVSPPAETVHEHLINQIRKHGKNVAQVDAATGEEMTFDAILHRAAALSAGLEARGLQHGEVAMLIGENGPHYPWVLLGVLQTGATAHPINHKSSPREVEHALAISRPKVVLMSSAVSESSDMTSVLQGSTFISHILVWGSEVSDVCLPEGVQALEQLILSPARSASSFIGSPTSSCSSRTVVDVEGVVEPIVETVIEEPGREAFAAAAALTAAHSAGTTAPPPTPTSPEATVKSTGDDPQSPRSSHPRPMFESPTEGVPKPVGSVMATGESVALLLSSSGSTGLPKAVMLTHKNILTALEQERVFMTPDDIMLGLSPYSHAFGGILMLMALSVGVKVVAIGRFSLEGLVDAVEKYSVTLLHVVPSLLVALSKHPEMSEFSLRMKSLRRIWTGAAQVSPLVQTEIRGRLPRVKLFHSYGMTETTFTTMHGEARADKPGSPGTLVQGMQCKIVDPDSGMTVSGRSVRGELCFRGPMIMKGYLSNAEATMEAVDSEGWLHSGDYGYYDEDGYYYIVDRLKDILKFNGYQISPSELEALLTTHPEIQDAAVVGVPHDYGDAPYALVVLIEGAKVTAQGVQQYIKERVAPHKHLRGGVSFVSSFPKTVSGKLQRKKLRALYMEPHLLGSCTSPVMSQQSEGQEPLSPPVPAAHANSFEADVKSPPAPTSPEQPEVSVEGAQSPEICSPTQAHAAGFVTQGSDATTPTATPPLHHLSPISELESPPVNISEFRTPTGTFSTADDSLGNTHVDSPMLISLTPATPPEVIAVQSEQGGSPISPQENC